MSDHGALPDDELEPEPSASRLKRALLYTTLALITLAGVGAIGQFAGTGWFGHRLMLYGSSDLYLLNLSSEPLRARVEGGASVKVPAEDARVVPIIGGDVVVEVLGSDDDVVRRETLRVENSHALVKLGGDDRCLIAVDISPHYGMGDKSKLRVLARLRAQDRTYVPGSLNVVWPRRAFPSKLESERGVGVWVETIGCPLLDDASFLDAYMIGRLQQRIDKATGGPPAPTRRVPPGVR